MVIVLIDQCAENGGFWCPSQNNFYKCLEQEKVCDGIYECQFGEDELQCIDERLYPYGESQGDVNILSESFNPLATPNRKKRYISPSGYKYVLCEEVKVNGKIGALFGHQRYYSLYVSTITNRPNQVNRHKIIIQFCEIVTDVILILFVL